MLQLSLGYVFQADREREVADDLRNRQSLLQRTGASGSRPAAAELAPSAIRRGAGSASAVPAPRRRPCPTTSSPPAPSAPASSPSHDSTAATCGTTLEGDFSVGRFGRLNRDQLVLLESFLRSRGNLREMERELGISYPTVRGRVEALVRALGFGPRSDADEADEPATPGRAAGDAQPGRGARSPCPSRDQRRGRRRGDPRAREDRPMTTATGFTMEHPLGLEGRLSIRIRSGEVRLRGADGDVVRVRDVNGQRAGRHVRDHRRRREPGPGRRAAGSTSAGSGFGPRDLLAWMEPNARDGSAYAPELVVDVPRRAAVVVEAASGEIVGEDLLGEQRYRTASGDVTLARRERPLVRRGGLRRRRRGRDRDHRADRPNRLGRHRGSCRHPGPRPGRLDQRRPPAGRPVRRPGPVQHRDGQRRRPPGAGRRHPDPDDQRDRRPELRVRGSERDPWPAVAHDRAERARDRASGRCRATSTSSGPSPPPVTLPRRRRRLLRAAPALRPRPASNPSRRATTRSPPPTTKRACASCARWSAARSTSPRRAGGSRCSTTATPGVAARRQPARPRGRRGRRCLRMPSSASCGSSARGGSRPRRPVRSSIRWRRPGPDRHARRPDVGRPVRRGFAGPRPAGRDHRPGPDRRQPARPAVARAGRAQPRARDLGDDVRADPRGDRGRDQGPDHRHR